MKARYKLAIAMTLTYALALVYRYYFIEKSLCFWSHVDIYGTLCFISGAFWLAFMNRIVKDKAGQ